MPKNLALPLVVAASALTLACSSDEDAGVAGTPLPCEVERVLADNCRQCHAARPRFGAPMPLVSWEDLQRPARSDPSKTVWQRVSERIHDAQDPMPPTGRMATGELSVLDGWMEGGAPAGSAACGAAPPPPPAAGPETLPCTPTDTFVAGDGAGGGFHVPESESNYNHCFVFPVPWQAGSQGLAFAPIIDDERVLHHWILFSTSRELPAGSFPCDGNMPLDSTFIAGWAPGGGNNVLPDDVGMELPSSGALVLQIHYWNAAGYTDVADRSGVAVCATTEPRPHAAAVHTLGSLAIAIPPRSVEHEVVGRCTPDIQEPVHVIGAGPHMHLRGTSIDTTILRGGDDARSETLVAVPHWDFNGQSSHPASATVLPGDVLRTTCRYTNESSQTIYFGERTEDEMCFDFVLAYPAGALVNRTGSLRRTCIDPRTTAP